jgi:hypothetical protein
MTNLVLSNFGGFAHHGGGCRDVARTTARHAFVKAHAGQMAQFAVADRAVAPSGAGHG